MDFPFPIMLLVTCIAALGFALFFNVNKRHIASATLGGVLTWAIDYLLMSNLGGVFIPCLIASAFAAIYAEALARITKTPVAVFFIISVIPLIPGRVLYYTMYNAVSGNISDCLQFATTTMLYAAGIAVGMCLVTAVVQTWDSWVVGKAKRLARLVRKQAKQGSKPLATNDAKTAKTAKDTQAASKSKASGTAAKKKDAPPDQGVVTTQQDSSTDHQSSSID